MSYEETKSGELSDTRSNSCQRALAAAAGMSVPHGTVPEDERGVSQWC